jgi:hypothetical protein
VNNSTYPTLTTLNQLAGVLLFLVENPAECLPEHIQEPELVIIPHYIMKLVFLYSIQIVGQTIITGSQKVSKYHVPRRESSIPYIEIIKINILLRNHYKKYCTLLKRVVNEAKK